MHVFVTGPSGGGKTTLAKLLQAYSGWPLVRLDHVPAWDDYLISRPDLEHMEDRLTRGTKEWKDYQAVRRHCCRVALDGRDKMPTIFEGSQLLVDEGRFMFGHGQIYVIDIDVETLVMRRIDRDNKKRKKNYKDTIKAGTPEWYEREFIARACYKQVEDEIEEVIDTDPGVILLGSTTTIRQTEDIARAFVSIPSLEPSNANGRTPADVPAGVRT